LVSGHERSPPLPTNDFADDVFHKLRDLPKRPHCSEHPNRLFTCLPLRRRPKRFDARAANRLLLVIGCCAQLGGSRALPSPLRRQQSKLSTCFCVQIAPAFMAALERRVARSVRLGDANDRTAPHRRHQDDQ
jgi:hypothetical protein